MLSRRVRPSCSISATTPSVARCARGNTGSDSRFRALRERGGPFDLALLAVAGEPDAPAHGEPVWWRRSRLRSASMTSGTSRLSLSARTRFGFGTAPKWINSAIQAMVGGERAGARAAHQVAGRRIAARKAAPARAHCGADAVCQARGRRKPGPRLGYRHPRSKPRARNFFKIVTKLQSHDVSEGVTRRSG